MIQRYLKHSLGEPCPRSLLCLFFLLERATCALVILHSSETGRIRFRRVRTCKVSNAKLSEFFLLSPSSGERAQWVPLSLVFVCTSELTEFLAELTEFAAELSEFSPPKQYPRNSIPPVSYFFLSGHPKHLLRQKFPSKGKLGILSLRGKIFPLRDDFPLKIASPFPRNGLLPMKWRAWEKVAFMAWAKMYAFPPRGKIDLKHFLGLKRCHGNFLGSKTPSKRGKLFYLQLELFCLQLSFFAYSPSRPLLDALSHCKQKSSNCKQKS